jgi:hypothetical protein
LRHFSYDEDVNRETEIGLLDDIHGICDKLLNQEKVRRFDLNNKLLQLDKRDIQG